jgi:hypothetical protein
MNMRCKKRICDLKTTFSKKLGPASILERCILAFFKMQFPKSRGAKHNIFAFFAKNAIFLLRNGGQTDPKSPYITSLINNIFSKKKYKPNHTSIYYNVKTEFFFFFFNIYIYIYFWLTL